MIIKFPSVELKKPVELFDFEKYDGVEEAKSLAEALLTYDGVSLAANQLALPYKAVVVLAEQILVMFNPAIVSVSDDETYLVEGCLSNPNLFLNIKRPEEIRVRYSEPNGNVVTRKFTGFTSHVVQNSIDRLNGIDFSQRANRFFLERGRKAQKHIKVTPRQLIQQYVKG